MMKSNEYKKYDTNKKNFMTRVLKKETGAVIKDSEMNWMDQTYFPQMGDSPEVIEQKKQLRTQAEMALQQDAERSMPNAELGQAIEQARSAGGSIPMMQEGGPATMPMMQGQDPSVPMPMMGGLETGAVINDAQKTNFANAILRRETGAVINDSEMQWIDQTYFPQRGDSPQVQAQKSQARDQAIQALQGGSERDRSFGNRASRSMGLPETGSVEEMQIMQEMQGMSEEDKARLQNLLEQGQIKTDAPLADIAEELKAAGTGEDTQLAHLRPGEMVIPPEFLEDTKFESMLEKKYKEFDINPEQAVVGAGIASLNATTGLEEFGFFKKIGKGLKKVAKKIAPIAGPLANFIPGIGPLVAGAIGAATNVVAGGGLKGAVGGFMGGYGTGKMLGGIGGLGKVGGKAVGSGNFGSLGFKGKLGALKSGLTSGNLTSTFFNPAKGSTGMFGGKIGPGIRQGLGSLTGFGQGPQAPQFQPQLDAAGNPTGMYTDVTGTAYSMQDLQNAGMMDRSGNLIGSDLANLSNSSGGGGMFGGNPGQSRFGLIEDFLKGRGSDPVRDGGGGGLGGLLGGGGGGGMGALGAMGAAGLLGKLAYEEAKNAKGVELTPLTTMDASGRYNIEAEIARRMGQDAPNPTEFGLLPQGTFPTLSGGQPQQPQQPQGMNQGGGVYPNEGLESLAKVAPEVVARMGYNMGGYVMPMAYATGGDVAVEDFDRKNGFIEGPGTETSDDVPAMLSDGEFVMTGAAVRGAGTYNMENNNGIVTLTPSGEEDRKKGTDLMYEMMGLFESYGTA